MPTSAFHHPGLRVSDIDAAAQFYVDALEGERLTLPFVMDGDYAAMCMQGEPGMRFKVCHVGFDEGMIELFEFLEPAVPPRPVPPTEGTLIHIGLRVDDVAGALARVEAAGGRRLFPEIAQWRSIEVIYVADPWGNVLELTDCTPEESIRGSIEVYPEADPAGDGKPSDVPFDQRGVSVG
jgi:catechol 2,3-dioxygenase-like lactoylglutathione lyase family enzyme